MTYAPVHRARPQRLYFSRLSTCHVLSISENIPRRTSSRITALPSYRQLSLFSDPPMLSWRFSGPDPPTPSFYRPPSRCGISCHPSLVGEVPENGCLSSFLPVFARQSIALLELFDPGGWPHQLRGGYRLDPKCEGEKCLACGGSKIRAVCPHYLRDFVCPGVRVLAHLFLGSRRWFGLSHILACLPVGDIVGRNSA